MGVSCKFSHSRGYGDGSKPPNLEGWAFVWAFIHSTAIWCVYEGASGALQEGMSWWIGTNQPWHPIKKSNCQVLMMTVSDGSPTEFNPTWSYNQQCWYFAASRHRGMSRHIAASTHRESGIWSMFKRATPTEKRLRWSRWQQIFLMRDSMMITAQKNARKRPPFRIIWSPHDLPGSNVWSNRAVAKSTAWAFKHMGGGSPKSSILMGIAPF